MHIMGRKPWAYYNDFEPSAVAWLKELIKRGLIADGEVDGRSILDVDATDLTDFTQCHFFAGIGGWSYALRLVGWRDDWPVWTGSPPCFPAGTLIVTARGIIQIEDVRVGDMCLTHKGRWRPVIRTGCAEKPVLSLKGQGHFGIVTTKNHPFYARTRCIQSTRRNNKPIRIHRVSEPHWVRADRMAGKWWAFPKVFPPSDQPKLEQLTPWELGFIAGAYVGDGWISKGNDRGKIILGVSEAKAAEILEMLPDADFYQCKTRTGVRLVHGDRELGAFLQKNFGEGSLTKRIPLWMMSASDEVKQGFIDGWDLTDGTRKEHSGSKRITTASRQLVITGRMLLLTMGYTVSMRKIITPDRTMIEGRNVSQADYYTINRSRNMRFRIDDEQHVYMKVKSSENLSERQMVYDLEVDGDHSYVADGIVVHNCQPFSAAGMQKGKEDERHLAPHFAQLVAEGRPPILFGEQVASAAVFGKAASSSKRGVAKEPEWAWIDDLSHRLEDAHYAVGASDIPAAGIGAPHIRQRTFFGAVDTGRLADSRDEGSQRRLRGWSDKERQDFHGHIGRGGTDSGLADARCVGVRCGQSRGVEGEEKAASGEVGEWQRLRIDPQHGGTRAITSPLDGFWRDADWLFCRDGKWRPAESSVQCMVDGIPAELVRSGAYVPATFPLAQKSKDSRRAARLRGYGNAIVPQAAATFIQAFIESLSVPENECDGDDLFDLLG